MKKVTSILIISVMLIVGLFVLTGCGDNETATGGSSSSGTSRNDGTEKQQNQNDNMSEEEKLLAKVGLELSKVKPNEEYYRMKYDADDKEFTFYMEKGTEKNVGEYVHKVYNACKEISSDKKIYKANLNFFMQNGNVEEYELKSVAEINEGSTYNYIGQFGYLYGGGTITVTVCSASDMDGEKDDDIYYPIYTVSFDW